jgi:hypothetical protein
LAYRGRDQAEEIRALIDRLVSANRKVQEGDSGGPDLPRDFDPKRQEQVNRALSKLTRLGPQAFPFLIERWGDERYCLTASDNISGAYLQKTVGQVCRAVIFVQLQPYGHWPAGYPDPERNRRPPHRPRYPDRFLGSQQSARQWWATNKNKSLREMQLEALDWVIAEEAKRPGDFKDEERTRLRQVRKKIAQADKPLPAARVGDYDGFEVELGKRRLTRAAPRLLQV